MARRTTWSLLGTICVSLLVLMACDGSESPQSAPLPVPALEPELAASVDRYVETVLERYGIPGASLAIVRKGQLIHRNDYGFANVEHQVPIHDESIYRVYSITKVFVASALFNWIESGELSLNDPIDRYVADLPLAWRNVTIEQLLAHTSGLPDINAYRGQEIESARDQLFAEPIRFDAGERYDYNQTNTWLLRELASNLTQGEPDAWLLKSQFPNSTAEEVFFSSDSRDPIRNRVTAYFPFVSGRRQIEVPFDFPHTHFSNGINLTMGALLDWNARLDSGELINDASLAKLIEPYTYRDDSRLFGRGWGLYPVAGRDSYGFSGSLVTAFRKFPQDDLTIVLLGGGMGYFFQIEALVDHLAGMVDEDLFDAKTAQTEKLVDALMSSSVDPGIELAQELHSTGSVEDLEAQLNVIGYGLLARDRVDDALTVFALNVDLYPNSFNVYDSLAEGYENAGRPSDAISFYRKSLEFNPANAHATERLEQLAPTTN